MPVREGREPAPQCGLEPADRLVVDAPAACPRCRGRTSYGLVVCGWCAEEVGICVFCGGDLRNGRPDGWTYVPADRRGR